MAYSVLQNHRFRQITSLLVAGLLIASISFLGVQMIRSSQAATGGSLALTATTTSVAAGSNISVVLHADSGAEAVNAVQAAITYDTGQLQFVSLSEGSAYTVNAATSTNPGLIRVGRGASGAPITGNNTVVTVNFKVLATSGTTTVNIDRQFSALARSSDSSDILQTVSGTSFAVTSAAAVPQSDRPVFYLTPSSGTYAVGSTIAVGIRVKSSNTTVTTVQPVINYPADKLSYVSLNEGSTFKTSQRTRTNNGVIDLIRGISGGSSGVTGDNLIATVTFKVIADGGSALSFANSSAAFDASGTGSNVIDIAASAGASYASSPTTNASQPQTSPPGQSQSSTSRSGSVSVTGGTVRTSGAQTRLQGEVALTPLADPSILAQNPGDYVVKVDYLLDTKLIASKTVAPFSYSLNTKSYKNGSYALTVKTFYKSGTVDTKTDMMRVANPVTPSYLARHYGGLFLLALAALAAIGFIVVRVLIPRYRTTQTAQAAPVASGYDAFAPLTSNPVNPVATPKTNASGKELFAPDPTVIAPAGSTPIASNAPAPDVSQQAIPLKPVLEAPVEPRPEAPSPQVTTPQVISPQSVTPVVKPAGAAPVPEQIIAPSQPTDQSGPRPY